MKRISEILRAAETHRRRLVHGGSLALPPPLNLIEFFPVARCDCRVWVVVEGGLTLVFRRPPELVVGRDRIHDDNQLIQCS